MIGSICHPGRSKNNQGMNVTTTIDVAANDTAHIIRDKVNAKLAGLEFDTISTGSTKLEIGQQNGNSFDSFFLWARDANGNVTPPKLIGMKGAPSVAFNGLPVTPEN